MQYLPFDRATSVARPADAVAAFIAHVPNLPRWTRFFVEVGGESEGGYRVTTQVGPAVSWTEVDRSGDAREVSICTRFPDRQERARVDVVGGEGSTSVRFHVRLPDAWPEERRASVIRQLEGELATLKGLLEGGGAQCVEQRT
ncbi:hypothetical protein WME76_37925 [Sorangium sp. So ce119]|uniref:hypothetical protein n=1 Tax=Sorangium sp. So ce119 TaxID=3133279 RepID=UPI003F60B57D